MASCGTCASPQCRVNKACLTTLSHALRQRDSKLELLFVVRRLSDNRVVGTTRYYQIKPEHRNFSIGYTWCREFLPSRG
ncbi:MAG: hypothetical protein ACI9SP_003466 [Arenicella sp.]|jgi:hypothetical protein